MCFVNIHFVDLDELATKFAFLITVLVLLKTFFVENPQSPFYVSAIFQQVLQRLSQKNWVQKQISLKKSVRSLIMAR